MSDGQTRRAFIHGVGRFGAYAAGLVLLGGCAVSPGQGRGGAPPSRVATIGYFSSGGVGDADDSSILNVLRQGLRELGWVEGENLRLEVRVPGDPAALADLVAQLVAMPVEVIVSVGGEPTIRAAASATGTLPIVMVQGAPDVVELGFAASIQRPGGNVTGLVQAPREIFGKRLELLLEAAPHVSRVAYIGGSPDLDEFRRETARSRGVEVERRASRSERDVELAFEAIDRDATEAVFVEPGTVTTSQRARIIDFAAQHQLPAMYNLRPWAEAGGLMSYGVDSAVLYRRAAFYVDRILRGTKPGDLPIEYPTGYEFVTNLKTADALGLTIPDSLLAQATEVLR